MIKIGFMHIPRTGGTYLESLLSQELGPERFANFFGTPENQKHNKISIIENIAKDKKKQQALKNIIDNPDVNYFSGHFSLNIERYLPKKYSYKYICIIRDPLSRVVSFVKKVTTSKTFHQYITKGNVEVGSDEFWFNYKTYVEEQRSNGLMPHERNGFNNYMTKCLAGEDLSNPFLTVNHDTYNKALDNLHKFDFIGTFENYELSIKNILQTININPLYRVRQSHPRPLPQPVADFIKENNYYDYKIYKRISIL